MPNPATREVMGLDLDKTGKALRVRVDNGGTLLPNSLGNGVLNKLLTMYKKKDGRVTGTLQMDDKQKWQLVADAVPVRASSGSQPGQLVGRSSSAQPSSMPSQPVASVTEPIRQVDTGRNVTYDGHAFAIKCLADGRALLCLRSKEELANGKPRFSIKLLLKVTTLDGLCDNVSIRDVGQMKTILQQTSASGGKFAVSGTKKGLKVSSVDSSWWILGFDFSSNENTYVERDDSRVQLPRLSLQRAPNKEGRAPPFRTTDQPAERGRTPEQGSSRGPRSLSNTRSRSRSVSPVRPLRLTFGTISTTLKSVQIPAALYVPGIMPEAYMKAAEVRFKTLPVQGSSSGEEVCILLREDHAQTLNPSSMDGTFAVLKQEAGRDDVSYTALEWIGHTRDGRPARLAVNPMKRGLTKDMKGRTVFIQQLTS